MCCESLKKKEKHPTLSPRRTLRVASTKNQKITTSTSATTHFHTLTPTPKAELAPVATGDGFLPYGQRQSADNITLAGLFYSQTVFRGWIKVDPTDSKMFDLCILPESFRGHKQPLSIYLGPCTFFKLEHDPDTDAQISADLDCLALSDHLRKYANFRSERHTKHFARCLLTPTSFAVQHQWQELLLDGNDSRRVTLSVPAFATTPPSDNMVTERLTLNCFLANGRNHGVTNDTIRTSFFEEKAWEVFLRDGMESMDDALGQLPSSIRIESSALLAASLHASAATFFRLLRKNLDSNNQVGYLTGSETSHLSAVTRLHAMHHPIRTYDVGTATVQSQIRSFSLRRILQFRQPEISFSQDGESTCCQILFLALSYFAALAGPSPLRPGRHIIMGKPLLLATSSQRPPQPTFWHSLISFRGPAPTKREELYP